MKKLIIYILPFITLFTLFSCSKDELNQLPPDIVWEKKLQTTQYDSDIDDDIIINKINDNMLSLANTSDNGFVLAINDNIRKYSSEGDSLWEKDYGQPIKAFQKLDNEEHLLYSNTENDIWIAKTDVNWDVIWQKRLDFEVNQFPFIQTITVGNDGYYLALRVGSNTNAHSHLYKLAFDGEVLWRRKFQTVKLRAIRAMEISSDGNLYIVGGASNNSTSLTRPWFAKVNTDSGGVLEEKIFDDEKEEDYRYFGDIKVKPNGDFILTMNTKFNTDIVILNKDGEIQFNNDLRNSHFESFVKVENNQWLMVAKPSFDGYAFAKLDDNGYRIWQMRLGETDFFGEFSTESGISACQLTNGNYILISQPNYSEFYKIINIKNE